MGPTGELLRAESEVNCGWPRGDSGAKRVTGSYGLFCLLHCAALLVVTGCSSVEPYPTAWAPTAPVIGGACPDLRGTWNNIGTKYGQAVRNCGAPKGIGLHLPAACTSLVYNLMGPVGWWPARPDIPSDAFLGHLTIIEQPSPDQLDIVTDQAIDKNGTTRLSLRASKGDFSCGAEGLTLRSKSGVSTLESVDTEKRSFNIASDGTLVMKVISATRGLLYVVPMGWSQQGWVKWERVSQEPMPQAQ